MIYVFGNCQAANTARNLAAAGLPVCFRWMHSPAFFRIHRGSLSADFAAKLRQTGTHARFLRSGVDHPWRAPLETGDPAPAALVFTLFVEQQTLFVDKTHGNGVYLNPAALSAFPDFAAWIEDRFEKRTFAPGGYLGRYLRMLATARSLFPKTPVVVIRRSQHAPAYDPSPRCLLGPWNENPKSICAALEEFSRGDPLLRLVDPDRTVAGGLARGQGVDRFYPSVLFEQGDPARPWRDMEHAPDALWSGVALDVIRALDKEQRPQEQSVPDGLRRPWQPETSPQKLAELLAPGDHFSQTRALAAMVLGDAARPRLLAAKAANLELHSQIVNALVAYARAKPDPVLALVAETLARKNDARLAADGDAFRHERFASQLKELAGAVDPARACPAGA